MKYRIGEINYNNFGSKMKIIAYRSANDIDIYFEEYDCIVENIKYQSFKDGYVKCPYETRTYGVGYIGEGKYKSRINNKKTNIYITWNNMLKRCYKEDGKDITYDDCIVCEEWHNFQNFAKWFEENYYEVEGETMALDKDILVKNNKIYSSNTCIFVPNRINVLFTKADKIRGEYPIGINYHKRDDVLEVWCSIYEDNKKKHIYLGRFKPNQIVEAFNVYKNFKESYIKQVADEYKPYIPKKLYDAMYRYEVEIDD